MVRRKVLLWMPSLCVAGLCYVRHAVCEIDNKYHSFSSNLALSNCSNRHKMAVPLRPGQIVMVTGGAGFLGQHIVKLLQEKANHVKEVHVFDTKPFVKQLEYEDRKPVKSVVGDLRNAAEVSSAVKGVDAVIHTAGLVSFGTFPDTEGMENVNVRGTDNVINACLQQGVKRLLYTSTVDVAIGFNDVINGNEADAVPDKFLFPGYPDTKYRAECNVLRANGTPLKSSPGIQLSTVALRPNVMYGELDPYYVTNGLRAASRQGGTLTRVGDGSSLFQQAYAGNVAWGHLVALEELERREQVGGKAYFLTDDTPLMNTFKFMQPFMNDRGFNLSKGYIPYTLMYSILWPAEMILHFLKPIWKLELPTQLCSIIYINRNLYFSRDRAERELNYWPLYTYEEALRKSRSYYTKVALEEENGKHVVDCNHEMIYDPVEV